MWFRHTGLAAEHRKRLLLWDTLTTAAVVASSSQSPNRRAVPLPLPLFSSLLAHTLAASRQSDLCHTTQPLPAETIMLTALSIEQYSFTSFTTLLYRPPCGGIALDVYNYS